MLLFATATALLNGSRGLRLLFDYSVVQPRALFSAILPAAGLACAIAMLGAETHTAEKRPTAGMCLPDLQ